MQIACERAPTDGDLTGINRTGINGTGNHQYGGLPRRKYCFRPVGKTPIPVERIVC